MDELIAAYLEGEISDHEFATDCLHMIDPKEPELVLAPIPDNIYVTIVDYACDYDPTKAKPKNRIVPTYDQVDAAARWVKDRVNKTVGSKTLKDTIHTDKSFDLIFWANAFHVSPHQIKEAIQTVGPLAGDVEKYVKQLG